MAAQYFKKLIILFHKNQLNKLTATSPTINTTLLIARPTCIKKKQGWLANTFNKQIKKI